MAKKPSYLEIGLSNYLKNVHSDEVIGLFECDSDAIHQEVEIGILFDGHKHSKDALWIEPTESQRVGANLRPGLGLRKFFEMVNVHPRDVITSAMLELKPAESDGNFMSSYMSPSYRDHLNRQGAEIVKGYLDLLTDFVEDISRPAICSPEMTRIILENTCYGGIPLIAGRARISDVMKLDFTKPIVIGGKYEVGIHNYMNGSGHTETDKAVQFTRMLDPKELMVLTTWGHTPDDCCGFSSGYYKLELANAVEVAKA